MFSYLFIEMGPKKGTKKKNFWNKLKKKVKKSYLKKKHSKRRKSHKKDVLKKVICENR